MRCSRDGALRSRQDAVTVDDVPADRTNDELCEAAWRPPAALALCGHRRHHQVRGCAVTFFACWTPAGRCLGRTRRSRTAQRHLPHRRTLGAVPRPRTDTRWRDPGEVDQLGVIRDRQAALFAVADGWAGDDGHSSAIGGDGGHRDRIGDESDLGRQNAAAAPAARRCQATSATKAHGSQRDILHDHAAKGGSAAGISASIDCRSRATTLPQLGRMHPAHLPDRGRARLLPRAVGVVSRRGGGDDPVDALRAVQGAGAASQD